VILFHVFEACYATSRVKFVAAPLFAADGAHLSL
jgi:hypothetical protein